MYEYHDYRNNVHVERHDRKEKRLQDELDGYRKMYSTKEEESKLSELRRLNEKAHVPANVAVGINGTLAIILFTVGILMTKGLFGNLGIGIVASIIGFVCMCLNYPLYKKVFDITKVKYQDRIRTLADELQTEGK